MQLTLEMAVLNNSFKKMLSKPWVDKNGHARRDSMRDLSNGVQCGVRKGCPHWPLGSRAGMLKKPPVGPRQL